MVYPLPLSILQNLESKRFINLDLENKRLISEILILLELCLTRLKFLSEGTQSRGWWILCWLFFNCTRGVKGYRNIDELPTPLPYIDFKYFF